MNSYDLLRLWDERASRVCAEQLQDVVNGDCPGEVVELDNKCLG